jgi:hypothetical protein
MVLLMGSLVGGFTVLVLVASAVAEILG